MSRPAETPTRPAPAREPQSRDGADIAIVSEQIGEFGGTERVVAALLERYPDATVLAPRFDTGAVLPGLEPAWASRVQELRRAGRRRHHLAPVYARWMAAAPVDHARLVLSLAHNGWGCAVKVPDGARHISYSAGLARALYEQAPAYLRPYPAPVRPLLRASLPALRAFDRRIMRRPHRLLTNSRASADSVARIHGRRAEVIHPPVDTGFFTPAEAPRRHFLVVARLGPQKRVDAVLDAFRGLDEQQLVVAGGGPLLDELRASAPPNAALVGRVPDDELRRLYRQSHALICPSVEDFGIVMAEAHACATPVIAPRAGGALEIVDDGRTGVLVDRVEPAAIADAVCALRRRSFDAAELRASAERFSVERFVSRMERVVDEERELASGGC